SNNWSKYYLKYINSQCDEYSKNMYSFICDVLEDGTSTLHVEKTEKIETGKIESISRVEEKKTEKSKTEKNEIDLRNYEGQDLLSSILSGVEVLPTLSDQ